MASGSKIRHEWFQTDSFVTISVFAKGIKKEQVDLSFHEQSLSVCIHLGDSDYSLELDLCHPIHPSESLYDILSTKIEIRLKKATVGLQWTALEGQEPLPQATPSYPSSSKKKLDWNALEKTVEDEKPEGEQALNALFQQIYKDATEETRRAMIKSFTESNGTVLSTNWAEVGAKKVECTPPEGMTAKQYEK